MVALAENHKAAKGVTSDITDLTLRSGKQLVVELGAAVLPTPTLTRDMEASSSLEVPVYDPNLSLLDLSLLSEKFDAHVDGLRFRYLGASKSGRNLTLSFEDQVIARLREFKGPRKAFRAKQTRANFICGLVEELEPEVPIFCPQRHEKQPVEKQEKELPKNERQSKSAAKEAKETPGAKGVGDTKGLTVKGQAATAEQKANAEMALGIANTLNAPFRVQVALMSALIVETLIGTYGPGLSNILEAEGAGIGADKANAETQVKNFLTGAGGYGEGGAIGYSAKHPEATFWEVAQAMQRSGAGDATNGAANYGAVGDEARQIVEAYGGATEGELTSGSEEVAEPYTFQVGKRETYWAAIQRLAKEVEWRAFVVEGRFFFISEPELSRGRVQLAIVRHPGEATPENVGVIDVDFDFNANVPVTEVTLTALATHWTPRPGGVVTIAGYGPASLGPGDAPPEDGTKAGISSAVKVSTHEGKGRYLVSKIDSDLSGDADAREITITLVKPTQPLPEKATTKHTKAGAVGGEQPMAEGGSVDGMGIYEGTAEDVVNEVVFYAQKNGFPDLSPESVRAANATHGPTVDGTRSDHQGPPATAWAADISNGTLTPEEFDLATAIAKAFGIPWQMGDLTTHEAHGYRLQLIHGCSDCGGDHTTHVHFGAEVV